MKLQEYQDALEKLSSLSSAEARTVWAGVLAYQLENALWRPGYEREAAQLAGKFRKLQRT